MYNRASLGKYVLSYLLEVKCACRGASLPTYAGT